uniref:RNA-directed DNA polymerase homolog n=1 Tax=Nicotiana tabacum TaxID=4097 RepID=A0A1S4AD62_TOBAC
MQVVKGIKKGEPTFVATIASLEEHKNFQETVPPCIEKLLKENKDVMPDEFPKHLPPRRELDHKIELEPGANPPAFAPYRMAPPELEELRKQLKELLDAGHIHPSKASFGAPVTVKNKYPIPLIADLFDKLGEDKYFTKVDLRKGYYQIHITEGDEPKTACVTRYGAFECGCSAKAAPLTELLKKNKPWVWTEHCQKAFECLKTAVTEEPVFALPDFAKTFKTQKKLTPKQSRWQDFLAEFDYVLEYKLEKGNVVADALSRKVELAAITSARWDIREAIKEGIQHDLAAKELIKLANKGKTRRFWIEGGVLLTIV